MVGSGRGEFRLSSASGRRRALCQDRRDVGPPFPSTTPKTASAEIPVKRVYQAFSVSSTAYLNRHGLKP